MTPTGAAIGERGTRREKDEAHGIRFEEITHRDVALVDKL